MGKCVVLVAFLACLQASASTFGTRIGDTQEVALDTEIEDAHRLEAHLNDEISEQRSAMSSQPNRALHGDPLPSLGAGSVPEGGPASFSALQAQADSSLSLANDEDSEPAFHFSNPGQFSPTSLRGSSGQPRPNQSRYMQPAGLMLNTASVVEQISSKSGGDETAIRPSASKDVADVVQFGIFAKGFYGASLKKNKFTVDAVMALKWNDSRVVDLVPAGVDELSMSGKDALKKIWMPEVVVTNRDIKKYDLISTSVTIFRTGEVTKVERFGAIINQMYDLEDYPFDQQKMLVKVASSKYMLDEVVLEPDEAEGSSGARDGLLDGTEYELEDWRVYAFAETDGALKKSRGVLEFTIDRTFSTYREVHLMPTCLLLIISWGVFWFPFQNPFITPRMALSILALISFTNLMIKSSSALPDGAPHNWNDALNQQVQAMMFCTIVMNVFSEMCKHQFKVEGLGIEVNHEAKVLLPCLSITVVMLTMCSGAYGWMSLAMAGILTKLLIAIVMSSYIFGAMSRLQAYAEESSRKEAEIKRTEESLKMHQDSMKRLEQSSAQNVGSAQSLGSLNLPPTLGKV